VLIIKRDGWHEGYELKLVPGAHECDVVLTDAILKILQEEFKLKGAKKVEVYRDNPKRDQFLKSKDRQSIVNSTYPVGDVRFDSGKTTLESQLNHFDAVYYITHPYNLATGPDVATTVDQIELFGNTLKENNIDIKQLSLVTPIGPFDLNHSVDRKKKEGIIEGNRLEKYIKGIAREGYKEIIAISTHSPKTLEYASDNNIFFRDINPFRGPWGVSTPKLGPFFYKDRSNTIYRDDYKEQLVRLMPFLTELRELYEDRIDDVFFLAADDGIYQIMEEMVFAFRGDHQHILVVDTKRTKVGEKIIKGTKHNSTATLDDIKGKVGIIGDDRYLSGSTLNPIAHLFKEKYGVEELVGMIACDMAISPRVLDNSPFDKFFILETHPNSHLKGNDHIIRLPTETTAVLKATEIYHSYVSLRETGTLPKVR